MKKDETQILPDAKAGWDKDWKRVGAEYYWRLRGHYHVVETYLHGAVLDIGCGPGFLAGKVFPNEGWYTGVDISEEGIAQAKGLFPGAHFSALDVTKQSLPFPDRSFDTVVLSEIIEHLEDSTKVLAEAKRVCREYLVITLPISMGGVGHVWPTWAYADVVAKCAGLGTILELRECREHNFWLVWIRRA